MKIHSVGAELFRDGRTDILEEAASRISQFSERAWKL